MFYKRLKTLSKIIRKLLFSYYFKHMNQNTPMLAGYVQKVELVRDTMLKW